ncbi:hypothetical protein ACFP8W_00710 [Nocardioides hankookensis]
MTAVAPTVLTGLLGAALAASVLVVSPAEAASALGPVVEASSCTTNSSGLAKDVKIMVTKAKTVSAKRLSVEHYVGAEVVTVRVKLAVTATGTGTGYGSADACPGGVSNPQTVTKPITWKGTKTAKGTYTASARSTKKATKMAIRGATKYARATTQRAFIAATTRTVENTARDLAWAASEDIDPSPTPKASERSCWILLG